MFSRFLKVQSPNWKRRLRKTAFVLCGFLLLLIALHLIFPLPDRISYSTILTDRHGEIIHAYLTPDEKWRMKAELDEISPLLRKTILQKEDKFFYRHWGVNPFAMGRALIRNTLSGKRTSGASTITMQVARALEPKRRTVGNKVVEIFRALQLEWKYSKDEILQLYLNLVPYGGNIEGVKTASVLYFNKNPDHLSLAEITALSVIPNRPGTLVMGKHNDEIVKQRNKWLQRFAREKLFTPKEIEDALQEPLTAQRLSVPREAPHLSQKLRKAGGTLIRTTIDRNTQLKMEKLVADYVQSQRLGQIRNAAVIVLDNENHEVLAYVGSGDFLDPTDAGQVNGAAAVRQPGSTLKPLAYALCFDRGLLTPKKILNDVPVNYAGYAPENYDRQFNGPVSVEYALEHSLNIPAVKALDMLGIESMIDQLVACGFRQVSEKRKGLGLSMVLGGCGTTLEQMTGLYSVFANEGKFYPPEFLSGQQNTREVEVISPASSYLVTEILSRINRPDFPLHWDATAHMPRIAWKTGTSYGRRDAWSIGYNKKYTVGVWVGNFSGVGNPMLSGAETATPLLFRIFNTMDYDADRSWYVQPEGLDQRKICTETGMAATDHCASQVLDYFLPGISSNQPCDNFVQIAVSEDEKISYCKTCEPRSGIKRKGYRLMAPELQQWMLANKSAYIPIPPHNPSCEKIFLEGKPRIVSPVNGTEYLISKKHPEPLQLRCEAGSDVSRIYWYINDQFYKSSTVSDHPFFMPAEGRMKISCTDDKGRNRDIQITVKMVDL
jgi:penicillin-binding protein 1C